MPLLVATLLYSSQNYSYYIRRDRSPLKHTGVVFDLVNIANRSRRRRARQVPSLYFTKLIPFAAALSNSSGPHRVTKVNNIKKKFL